MKKLKAIAKLCRLNEIFLVIPFTVTSAFLASSGYPNAIILVMLVLASISGFSAGNIFNAMLDEDIDINNPRTSSRPLVKNELTRKECVIILFLCFFTVIICTSVINPAYLILLPIPITICLGYSVCKRFTWYGHFVLGIAHAICPVSGWVVFSSWYDWRAVIIGAIVFFWTLSLDMLYSLQDIDYDKKAKLFSIPSIFGEKATYSVSIISHVIMVALFCLLIILIETSTIFVVISIIAELLIITQFISIFLNSKNIKYAFNINQIFSMLILVASILNSVTGDK